MGDEDAHREELVHGDSEPTPAVWLLVRLPRRWRPRLAFLAVFCAGLLLGGYGTYAWVENQGLRDIRVTASIAPYNREEHGSLADLTLRNAGSRSVTLERARVDVGGFDTVSGGLQRPRTVRPGESIAVSYELRVVCKKSPGEAATIRLRTATAGQHWVEIGLPLRPAYSLRSLTALHTAVCSDERNVYLKAQTLDATRSSGGELAVRLRLTPAVHEKGGTPSPDLRLASLEYTTPLLRLSARSLGEQDAVRLPATVDIRVRVNRCEALPDGYPRSALTLRAGLTTETSVPGAFVRYDIAYARAVLGYIVDRCGQA